MQCVFQFAEHLSLDKPHFRCSDNHMQIVSAILFSIVLNTKTFIYILCHVTLKRKILCIRFFWMRKLCLRLNYFPKVRLGFAGGASGKEPAFQCRRHKRCSFIPWVGKIPWRRAWQPTPVFLPGKSQGQRNLEGYSP